MIEVTRIQYPVGQGCFHAGSLEWRREPQDGSFHYVYDCGSKNGTALKHSLKAMSKRHPRLDALFVSHLHEDHVNGLHQLLDSLCANTVFIPHLSVAATVAGLVANAVDGAPSHSLVEASLDPQGWFSRRGVSRVVRVLPSPPGEGPTTGIAPEDPPEDGEPQYAEIDWDPREARDGDVATGPADLQWMESGKMLAPGPGGRTLDWVFVPHVDPVSQADLAEFEGRVANVLDLPDLKKLSTQQLVDALQDDKQRVKLRLCMNCIDRNHNRVSMSVYSGPKSDPRTRLWSQISSCSARLLVSWKGAAGWIGTGDAELKKDQVRSAWGRSYRKFLPNLSTLLLPHHGSNGNFSSELLNYPNLACCIASASDPSQYGHPGDKVIESVRRDLKVFHHVSQWPGTQFWERIAG